MSNTEHSIHDLFSGDFEERVFVVEDIDAGRIRFLKPFADGDDQATEPKYFSKGEGWNDGDYGVAIMIVDVGGERTGVDSVKKINGDNFSLYMTTDGIAKEKDFVKKFLGDYFKDVYGVDFEAIEIDLEKIIKKASKSDYIKITPNIGIEEYQGVLDNKTSIIKHFKNKRTSFLSGNSTEYDDMAFDMIEEVRKLMPEEEQIIREIVIGEGYYVIPEHIQESLPAVRNMFMENKYPTILAVGASGTGKTTAAEVYARLFNAELVKFDVSNVIETSDYFYTRMVRDGQTIAEPTNFLLALLRGNCVILLDEINRVPTNVNNVLFPILDHNKWLTLNQPDLAKSSMLTDEEIDMVTRPEGFHIADHVLIVASANIGYGFSGTYDLDDAFFNRFPIIEVFSTPTKNTVVDIVSRRSGLDMDTSNKIVTAIQEIEKITVNENIATDCTIRAMMNCAKNVVNGMSIRASIMRSIVNPVIVNYPDNVKSIVEYLNTIYPPQKF